MMKRASSGMSRGVEYYEDLPARLRLLSVLDIGDKLKGVYPEKHAIEHAL